MNLDAVKRAPRWAWYTVGGVGAGGLALHLWKNRATSTGSTPAAGADPSTTVGSASSAPAGGATAVISPPIIVDSGTADQSGTGLGALQNLYQGGVSDLLGTILGGWSQMQGTQDSLLNSSVGTLGVLATANAGSPPTPAAPTPVIVNVPAPPPAPAAAPPPAPAPAPSGPPGFPLHSARGWYKVVCITSGPSAHGRWHYYSNGVKEHVSATC